MSSEPVMTWETWGLREPKALRIGDKVVWIRELSKEEYDEIRSAPMPQVPIDYKVDTQGKYILKDNIPEMEPKPDSPAYKQQMETAEQIRTLKILEYGLVNPDGKSIPGQTSEEKLAFLKKGTAGHLDKIALEILRISSLLPGDVDFLFKS